VNLNRRRINKEVDFMTEFSLPAMHFGDTSRLGRPFSKDPAVVRFGGRYLLYYSIPAFATEIAPPQAPPGWGIGIAESRDLVNWQKVGEFLPGAGAEGKGICAPGARVMPVCRLTLRPGDRLPMRLHNRP